MWDLMERKVLPISFPTTVGASTFIAEQFKIQKLKAQALIEIAVKDEFIKTVSETEDPADTWQALKNIFEAGNSSQILILSKKLHNTHMIEGRSIKEYLQTARDPKSNLAAMGHKAADETLVQLTLNGLSSSFEGII